ncbi:MAG: energy transducer TonB [Gammaproteobacteria bacterium]
MINYYSGFFISLLLHLGLLFSFSNYFSIDFLSYETNITSIPAYVVYENNLKIVEKPLSTKNKYIEVTKEKNILEETKDVSSILEKLELETEIGILGISNQDLGTDLEKILFYSSLIREQIMLNWKKPKSSKLGMQAEFIISLVPTGEIIEIEIKKRSGDEAFDRSALQAINKVNRFYDLQMPRKMFDENFRKFIVIFSPKE